MSNNETESSTFVSNFVFPLDVRGNNYLLKTVKSLLQQCFIIINNYKCI